MGGNLFSAATSAIERAIEAGDVPGIVACVGSRDGVIFSTASGVADTDAKRPMAIDTLFFIASMTKAVTSVALMQLMERGRVDLDLPASHYLPRLADAKVLEGFIDGVPRLRAPETTMTVRHLLAYTAGFAYPHWNSEIKAYVEWAGTPDTLTYREAALDMPLVSDPGTRWNYGIHSEFLGKIVELVSGERLDHYFDRHIFRPLGMTSTYFIVPEQDRHRIAKVHLRDNGGFAPIPLAVPEDPEFYPGGVGLFSSAPDYLRLTRALLSNGCLDGTRILAEETVGEMARDQLAGAPMAEMKSCDAFWSRDVELIPRDEARWGLGFLLNTQRLSEGRAPFSMAWAGACNSFYWIDREREVTGVFMASIVPFCDPQALSAFRAFERAVYASR